MRRTPIPVLAVLMISAAACSRATEMQPMTAQPAPIFMPPGQISGIVMTVNNGEIAMAELALEKATNARVREFAQTMITDHTDANQRVSALLAEEGWTSASSETAAKLEADAASHRDMLEDMDGADFDLHYMQTQVTMHERVLQQLEQILIRAAEDDDMEQLLRDLRPTIAAHLTLAQNIVADLEA